MKLSNRFGMFICLVAFVAQEDEACGRTKAKRVTQPTFNIAKVYEACETVKKIRKDAGITDTKELDQGSSKLQLFASASATKSCQDGGASLQEKSIFDDDEVKELGFNDIKQVYVIGNELNPDEIIEGWKNLDKGGDLYQTITSVDVTHMFCVFADCPGKGETQRYICEFASELNEAE